MATGYSLPAWLNQPTDTAGPLIQGLHLGATIAQERNRMEMQAQAQATQAAVASEQAQQRAMREQQEIEMQKAKMETEHGLAQQELAQAQQKIDMSVKQMAAKHMAQQRYQQLINAGEDPAKALLQVGPDLGISMTGAAQLYKAGQPQPALPDASVQEYGGEKFLKEPQRGGGYRYQQIKVPKDLSQSGPIQAQSVLDPITKKPIPGLVSVPSVSGAPTIHNIPDHRVRLAAQRLKMMEADPMMGIALQTDRDPVKMKGEDKKAFEKRLETFKKAKAEYHRLKAIVDEGMGDETGSSPYPEGQVLNHKDGSQWIVRGGRPVPMNQTATPSPPHDEEEGTSE